MRQRIMFELPVAWHREIVEENDNFDFRDEYGKAVIDLNEIIEFNDIDNATRITLSDGNTYRVNLAYDDFKNLYYNITLRTIHTIDDWLELDAKKS